MRMSEHDAAARHALVQLIADLMKRSSRRNEGHADAAADGHGASASGFPHRDGAAIPA
jgi:hypothetical protein